MQSSGRGYWLRGKARLKGKVQLLSGTVCGVLLCTAVHPSQAYAQASNVSRQSAERVFNIPAQRLDMALLQFGKQSGVQIVMNADEVRHYKGPSINGRHTPAEAVTILLRAVPLQAEWISQQTLVLKRQAPARRPAAVVTQEASPNAAPPGRPAEQMLQDIIVTAEKRETSLQDTPISIAVLSAEALEQRGIRGITDLVEGAVPSVRISPISGRNSNLFIAIRGVVPGDITQVSRDPTVGVYVDGVYLGRAQGLGTEMFDPERIEILRGPQGTLFGRNAVGGALSIVSKRPTGEFGLDVTAGVRNFNGQNVQARLNLPEIAGISIKVDGIWNRRDGWVKNPLPDQSDWYAYNRRGARVTALWQPLDDIDFTYSFDISRDSTATAYGTFDRLLPGAPSLPPLFSVEPDRVSRGRVGVQLKPSVAKVQGHSLIGSWKLSDELTLKSISAYRKLSQTTFANGADLLTAFTPNGLFSRLSYADVEQNQFSQEVQLIGSLDRLDFVLGAFYFNEDGEDLAYTPFTARFNADGTDYTIIPVDFTAANFPARASNAHTNSKAIFGQATFTPPIWDDRLHLTGGLRWTHDKKHGTLTRRSGAVIAVPFDFASKRLDPSATIAFDWTDDVNSYVRWGQAYRAGGANSRSLNYNPFEEEVVQTWEIGTKTQLFDRRVRLNVAAYSTRWKNRQVDFPGPVNPSATETVNTPGIAHIKGFEADLFVLLATGLTLTASYAFTDWKVPADVNPFTLQQQRGGLAFTPRHAASGAIDYEFPAFDFGKLLAHVDANYSSSYLSGIPDERSKPYALLNARLTLDGLRMGDDGPTLALSLWSKNITNTQMAVYEGVYAGGWLVQHRGQILQ